ncbi:unnamed protein product [Aphanomyces euteiches]|uniref:Uncharacterized protein n=1 Tax=Aphanomyces euteiches TaxID=100861 RepID=A0A6G0WLX2_9STRA|nr:hypothetical protein Ae201684_013865 [Aphanomyces euteiches]KAH9080901.1 hypothetical protein Ae201684P_007987 [Aphanomyces euteiches]KAH9155437.1 hypothetical protein AeRB84_002578 [Aphanomyces euteiches]
MARTPEEEWRDLNAATWEDVTPVFKSATEALSLGQLVHVAGFSYFDSMSALELMDPKMDSGMLAPDQAILTVEERLERGTIPLTFSSAGDLVATLDRIEQCEVAWRNGQPMAQSLLTCLYFHPCVTEALLSAPPTSLGTTKSDTLGIVFRAYLCLALKSIMIQRFAILRADVYEEEDFAPLSSDISLGDAVGEDKVITWLELADKRLDALTSKSKNKKKASSSFEALDSNPSIALDFATLFQSRLHYRRHFYSGLTHLGTAEAPDLEAAAKSFTAALDGLRAIDTEHLEVDAVCFSGKFLGFDNDMGRVLASTMPPRETQLDSKADCLKANIHLCEHLVVACSPGQNLSDMDELRAFLAHLSALRPNILVRSYVVLFLYIDKKMYGRYNFMDWLADSMTLTGVPSVLLSTQEGIQFSTRCIEAVYESLKCHLHNRPRQRHRLELLLDEWVLLQIEAASIDDKFVTEMAIPKTSYPRYFTSWALDQTCALMTQYLGLGFELDLYAPDEFTTIFWYMDYLLGSRIHNLTNAWSFVDKLKSMDKSIGNKAASSAAPTSTGTSSKKKKKGAKGSVNANADDNTSDPIKEKFSWGISLLEVHRAVTRALFQYAIGLHLDGLLPSRETAYGTASIRFQHRFKSFARLQVPAPLSYADLVKNCDFSKYDASVIFQSSDECFKLARTKIDQALAMVAASPTERERVVPELKALTKVCITNGVYLNQYSKQSKGRGAKTGGVVGGLNDLSLENTSSPSASKLHIAFDIHPQYPTLQVKPTTS